MFVCLCHQLTDRQLREKYREAENAAHVFELIGEKPVCGKCLEFIESDLRQCRECDVCPASADKAPSIE